MLTNSQSLNDLRKCANPASAHRSSEIARNCHETYTRIDRTFGSRLGIARLTVSNHVLLLYLGRHTCGVSSPETTTATESRRKSFNYNVLNRDGGI